jgi:hypothetical protein
MILSVMQTQLRNPAIHAANRPCHANGMLCSLRLQVYSPRILQKNPGTCAHETTPTPVQPNTPQTEACDASHAPRKLRWQLSRQHSTKLRLQNSNSKLHKIQLQLSRQQQTDYRCT